MIRKIALSLLILSGCIGGSLVSAATIFVTEITSAPPTVVIYQAAKTPFITVQHVQVSASSVRTFAFSSTTGLIRVISDTACHIVINNLPTATTNDTYLAANVAEYFIVNPGDELAVIAH